MAIYNKRKFIETSDLIVQIFLECLYYPETLMFKVCITGRGDILLCKQVFIIPFTVES